MNANSNAGGDNRHTVKSFMTTSVFRRFLLRDASSFFYIFESRNLSTSLAPARYPTPQGNLHSTGYAGDCAPTCAYDGHILDRPQDYVPACCGIKPDRSYHTGPHPSGMLALRVGVMLLIRSIQLIEKSFCLNLSQLYCKAANAISCPLTDHESL